MTPTKKTSALTPRSLAAALSGLVATAFMLHFVGAVDGWNHRAGLEAIALPALLIFVILLLLSGASFYLFRRSFFTRAELLFIITVLMIASPLATLGFWRYMLAATTTIPRYPLVEKLDGYPSKFWPQGTNLLEGAFARNQGQTSQAGNNATGNHLDQEAVGGGRLMETRILGKETVPALIFNTVENEAKGHHQTCRITIPRAYHAAASSRMNSDPADGVPRERFTPANAALAEGIHPDTPYFFSVLVKCAQLASDARYYVRIYYDENPLYAQELLNENAVTQPDILHKDGFRRFGSYGISIPQSVDEKITLEYGLNGQGEVVFADPRLIDVSAVEDAFQGVSVVSRETWESLAPESRRGLVVLPDRMLSREGLMFLLTGYVPWKAWWNPILAWGGFAVLVLVALYAIMSLMRAQWLRNERYPLPMAQSIYSLLGIGEYAPESGAPASAGGKAPGPDNQGKLARQHQGKTPPALPQSVDPAPSPAEGSALDPAANDTSRSHALPPIWHNRWMWAGFIITLVYGLLRLWHAYNPAVPDLQISFSMKSYLDGAEWGRTWNQINFSIYFLFLGLGLFMELHVLLSIVVGFLLFRLQYWFGESQGLTADGDYPYSNHQLFSSYLAYFVLVIFFTRKYFFRLAGLFFGIGASTADDQREAWNVRLNLLLLAATCGGVAIWAQWLELSIPAALVIFAFILALGFVSGKLRAECGIPHGIFTPYRLLAMMPLLGGFAFLEPDGIIFLSVFATLCLYHGFYLIPGMQLEVMEAGRRLNVRTGHIPVAVLCGIVGGMAVGGWVYLNSCYATGADNFAITGHFSTQTGDYKEYNEALVDASRPYQQGAISARDEGGQNHPPQPARAISDYTDSAVIEGLAVDAESSSGAPAQPAQPLGKAKADIVEPTTVMALVAAGLTTAVTLLRQWFAGFWFHPVGILVGPTEMARYIWGSLLAAWFIRLLALKIGGAATIRHKLRPFAVGILLGCVAAFGITFIVNTITHFQHPGASQFTGFF